MREPLLDAFRRTSESEETRNFCEHFSSAALRAENAEVSGRNVPREKRCEDAGILLEAVGNEDRRVGRLEAGEVRGAGRAGCGHLRNRQEDDLVCGGKSLACGE